MKNIESNDPTIEYSNEQIQTWGKGSKKYRKFFQSLSVAERFELFQPPDTQGPRKPVNVQMLFLGEKPAMLEKFSEPMQSKFRAVGFHTAGDYVYNPKAVAKVLMDNAEAFSGFDTSDPDRFMSAFAPLDIGKFNFQRGLLLGFPRVAIEEYLHTTDLHTEMHEEAFRLIDAVRNLPGGQKFVEKLRKKHIGNRDRYWPYVFFRDYSDQYASLIQLPDERLRELQAIVARLLKQRVFCTEWGDLQDSEESVAQEKRWNDAVKISGINKLHTSQPLEMTLLTVRQKLGSVFEKAKDFVKQGKNTSH